MPLAGLAWFAWVKTSDAARNVPTLIAHRSSLIAQKTVSYVLMSNPFGVICVSKKPRTLHADVPTLIAHCSRPKNLFFCSSVKNKNLRSSVASALSACHWKFFTKPHFRINPVRKSKVPSWKIFISQLENYFFSVGKSKFRSRANWNGILGLFLNYFKRFLFILTPCAVRRAKVKMFDIERWAVNDERWTMSGERWTNRTL